MSIREICGRTKVAGGRGLNVAEMSPWLDCRFPSDEEKLAVVAAQTHRRFIKSHLPVDALVFSPEAKYIYVGRDGRDILTPDDVARYERTADERLGAEYAYWLAHGGACQDKPA